MSAVAEPPVAPPAPAAPAPPNTPLAQPLPPPPGAFTAAALAKAKAPKPEPPATPALQSIPAPVPTPGSTTTTPAAKPDATTQPAPVAPEPKPDELPEHFSNAKAENWKRARELIKELETKSKTYTEQLKAKDDEIAKFKSKPQVDPEIQTQLETLKKQNEEYSGLVKRVAIEQSPEFQAHFKPKFEHAIMTAKAAAGDKAEQIVAIIEAQPGQWRKNALNEIYANMESESDKFAIASAVMRYDEVRNERNTEISNANTNYEQMKAMQAKKAEQKEKESAEVRQRNLDAALKKSEAVDAFKSIDGNAEHNAMVEANKTMLRKFMTHEGLSIEEYMDAPIQAGEAKRLKVVVDTLTKERDELQKAVAELQGANPGLRGGGASATPSGETVKTPFGESRFIADAMSRIRGK